MLSLLSHRHREDKHPAAISTSTVGQKGKGNAWKQERKLAQIAVFMTVHTMCWMSFCLTWPEFNQKARAGSNRWGEHGASAENRQNRQPGAERGFINVRAIDARPAETDLFERNAHTDAGCMSADPGLDTEAHMDQRHDINPRNTGPNVCVWLQISSLTKRSVCYCLPVFSSLLPRHLCLRFKSLK